MLLGIDVGSTTVKVCVTDGNEIFYKSYVRHYSKVKEILSAELDKVKQLGFNRFKVCVTGSAGLGVSQNAGLPFTQEVQAAFTAIKKYYPSTDVAIELGGEDAKIIFVTGGTEERMNGSCAGGTGAFIDQMATLLDIDVAEMDRLALKAEKVYPIASRCGVFAKSDIQPLLNQGAKKEDIAASIFQAVVDQTVSGLAQGRRIKGNVLFLGGPLYYLKGLRKAFVGTLKLDENSAIFPETAPNFMSIGAALSAEINREQDIDEIISKIKNSKVTDSIITSEPLFKSQKEYDEFLAAHDMDVPRVELSGYTGAAYLGIDSGSTTTKLVLISEDGAILFSSYSDNNGRPLDLVVRELKKIYELLPSGACIKGCCVTGYGEDLIKSALHADFGVVETVAHFKAALYFNPDVDFIIDIGGQDIKCFKIKNKAIDSIMLNEACSSGCGSFIQTFARAMNMDVAGFSRLGLFARHPVELGSRCTVFMNSAVKQAQKEGASVEDISAGLSTSIVKNAVYKVIRATSIDQLGDNIVVQGGTFLNDAVLRAFEREVGKKVVRPAISGLMGAFGAALYAKENAVSERSAVLTEQEVKDFSYTARSANCGGCTSRCDINIVTFSDGKKHVSGNKCERGAGLKPSSSDLDMYDYKQRLLADCLPKEPIKNPKATVGLPLQLGMYEQLPLWATFFARLGFQPVLSDPSSRDLYFLGQHTVASDTICYPAKLMHGHIESLLDKGVDFIFLPCESYNLDEHASVNHYNCPVVAYYSESLLANNERLTHDNFIMPYVDLNMTSSTVKNLTKSLSRYGVKQGKVKKALQAGFEALEEFHAAIRTRAQYILSESQRQNKPLIVLAGRPYHVDAEINHGINKLLTSLGLAVLTEDGAAALTDNVLVNVINQWTYHARLYKAANFVCTHPCAHMVQLVSFGCGIDAVTTDEIRSIMEKNDELYTQIKIDEINNLGVVKIRLRSMLAAIEEAQKAGSKRN